MKLVKLSVAAAMAAGLATSASAVELTEAIKGVELNGYVRYRMENTRGDNNAPGGVPTNIVQQNNTHNYKVRVGLTIPVNDDVNFKTTLGNTAENLNDNAYGSPTGSHIIHAYFQYTGVENLVVQAGKQAMPTPFNDDEHGNGLVALYNVGPVTLAGGYFDSQNASADAGLFNGLIARSSRVDVNNNPINADGTPREHTAAGDNVMALGVIGSIEMVNASLWYARHQNAFKAYTVDVNADLFDMANVGIRHTRLKLDDEIDGIRISNWNGDAIDLTKNTLTKVYASANIDMFDVSAAYGRTGNTTGTVIGALGGQSGVAYDSDAATDMALEQLSIGDLAKARAYHVGAGVTFADVRVGLDYLRGTNTNAVTAPGQVTYKNKFNEIMPSVSYAMSDNFDVSALYTRATLKDGNPNELNSKQQTTMSRVQVMYKF